MYNIRYTLKYTFNEFKIKKPNFFNKYKLYKKNAIQISNITCSDEQHEHKTNNVSSYIVKHRTNNTYNARAHNAAAYCIAMEINHKDDQTSR